MNIEIKKLTPALVDDYAHFFDTTPHWGSDETKCYCITWCGDNVYLNGGKHWFSSPVERRVNAINRIQNGDIQGYLAYFNNEVVGWCNANTKSDCKECINYLRTYGGVPLEECCTGEKVKIIFCITIAPKAQRMGVATQLLNHICHDAAANGFDFVEAFPNNNPTDAKSDYRGPLALYEKCGFNIHSEQGGKVVVRKMLK